jgi:predicted SAM-dependent methyltransferase
MTSKYFDPLRVLGGIGRRAEALQSKRATRKRLADARATLSRNKPPYKVNVGCGKEPFQGWMNLDLDPSTPADVLWDITDGLPFPDETCSFVYSEHFLEHIPVQQGVRFLSECRRCLQRGGVVRIAMPSIEDTIRHYYENIWRTQPWLEKYGYGWIKTRAEYVNISFREWGHQWIYDVEELERRMQEAGFSSIENVPWGESKYPELRSRETRVETRVICEATK